MGNYSNVKEWRKRTKEYLVKGFGGKCACCRIEHHPAAYDFHHVDPGEKDFAISTIKGRGWSKIVEEIQKCVMLCCLCHRLHHAGVLDIPLDSPRFDKSLCGYEKRIKMYDSCPVCGGEKETRRVTCSRKCAGKQRGKVDWSQHNVHELYAELGTYEAVGRTLGITGAAVKKQM